MKHLNYFDKAGFRVKARQLLLERPHIELAQSLYVLYKVHQLPDLEVDHGQVSEKPLALALLLEQRYLLSQVADQHDATFDARAHFVLNCQL